MKYEEIEQDVQDQIKSEQNVMVEPNIVYEIKRQYKVLKNTLFYGAVAILLILNLVFLFDLTGAQFTSSIAQGIRDFMGVNQTSSQFIDGNSSYVEVCIANIFK